VQRIQQLQGSSAREKRFVVTKQPFRKNMEYVPVFLALPGVRHTWDISPLGKVLMDEDFVDYVDKILSRRADT